MHKWIVVITVVLLSCSFTCAAETAPPNILIFLADDVDWRDLGCYGNETIQTPVLDELATEGVLYWNAFLTTPQCSPSRISVLTGKYPHATGAEDLHMPLLAGDPIVPGMLKKVGYVSGHMNKKHYGKHADAQFDWYSKTFDKFPELLDKAGEQPWFCWVGFTDAHRPYAPGVIPVPHDPAKVDVPPYLVDTPETRADLALYYDEIARMDGDIGRMLAAVKARGQLENTLVIYFGDNGMPFPRAKGTLYDSGVGTPLIISWPGKMEAGGEYSGLVSVVDFAPTLLEIAGVPKVNWPNDFQGTSMVPRMLDLSKPGRTYAFSERNWHDCDEHLRSVRTKKYKLIRNAYLEKNHGTAADLGGSPSFQSLLQAQADATITDTQNMIFVKPRPLLELYDVVKDPWETQNLAETKRGRKVAQELDGVLQDWMDTTGDFEPQYRRRGDHTDRETGERTQQKIPPMTNLLP